VSQELRAISPHAGDLVPALVPARLVTFAGQKPWLVLTRPPPPRPPPLPSRPPTPVPRLPAPLQELPTAANASKEQPEVYQDNGYQPIAGDDIDGYQDGYQPMVNDNELWDPNILAPPQPGQLPLQTDLFYSFGPGENWLEDRIIRAIIMILCYLHLRYADIPDVNVLGLTFQRNWVAATDDIRSKPPRPPALQSKIILIPICVSQVILDQSRDMHWATLELNRDDKTATLFNGFDDLEDNSLDAAKVFLRTFNKMYDLGLDAKHITIKKFGVGDRWSCGLEILEFVQLYLEDGRPNTSSLDIEF
jgi:hypothetical protein